MGRYRKLTQPPRYQERLPMSQEDQLAHYERLTTEQGIQAAAGRAASRGVTLMVQGLEYPHYAVPYPEFAQQVAKRHEVTSNTTDLERVSP